MIFYHNAVVDHTFRLLLFAAGQMLAHGYGEVNDELIRRLLTAYPPVLIGQLRSIISAVESGDP